MNTFESVLPDHELDLNCGKWAGQWSYCQAMVRVFDGVAVPVQVAVAV
jgi:hypothetical protein